jgi:hypothetical protein
VGLLHLLYNRGRAPFPTRSGASAGGGKGPEKPRCPACVRGWTVRARNVGLGGKDRRAGDGAEGQKWGGWRTVGKRGGGRANDRGTTYQFFLVSPFFFVVEINITPRPGREPAVLRH